ncbi:MAG: hypothetical protein ABIH63_04490 [archaeon]
MVKLVISDTLALKIEIVLYIILGGLVGLVYGLRRVIMMERRIIDLEKKITKALEKKR